MQIYEKPVGDLLKYIYPKIYPIHNLYNEKPSNFIKVNEIQYKCGDLINDSHYLVPPTIRLSLGKIDLKGIYLIDNGDYIYLYVLHKVNPDLIK